MGRLGAKGTFVEEVAEDSEEEDCYREAITGVSRVTASKLGEDFVVVF
jgi:hypothetical protein